MKSARSAAAKAPSTSQSAGPGAPQTISGRWLLKAFAVVCVGALLCCWGALCLLFWQGSWQLLYHPTAAVVRTPASAGLRFDNVEFAVDEAGQVRLKGWWLAADVAPGMKRHTILYLHGESGNLGDTVDALKQLHGLGMNVLAFDYRGFGESRFARPSEKHWREDTEWAIQYLTGTRHVSPDSIVLDGYALGANLALEVAAAHPELAGVIVCEPLPDAASRILNDPRARLVPARLLVRDRYDLDPAAGMLRIPSLWILRSAFPVGGQADPEPVAYKSVNSRKAAFWFVPGVSAEDQISAQTARWMGDLPSSAADSPKR